ncbi:MAG: hypothetical protein ACRBM6_12785 [Geminicoccales bacterium]
MVGKTAKSIPRNTVDPGTWRQILAAGDVAGLAPGILEGIIG